MNEDLEQKLLEFKIWALTLGRYHPSTVAKSVRTIKMFSRIMDVFHPDQKKILDYFASRITRGVKPHTLNNQRKDLHSWFRFLGVDVELPKLREPPSPDPWIPSNEEAERILYVATHSSIRRDISLRNGAIAYLAFFGGLRVGEIIRLNVTDVMEKGIRVRSEKGEAERIIGLPDNILSDINLYIKEYRAPTDKTALFTTSKGRLTYGYLRNLAKMFGARAGVKNFHWHAARHWCATSLLRGYRGAQPVDIRMVQIHLGHLSLRTTQRYTHVTQQEVAE
ncbi:MAG: tyrosine-type recombinase/integrase, partial [Candidatus Micrarchaeaceae archaeon]